MKVLISVLILLASMSAHTHDRALDEAYSALYGASSRQAVAAAENLVNEAPGSSEAWRLKGDAYSWRATEVNIFRRVAFLRTGLEAYERAAEIDQSNIAAQVILLTVYSILPDNLGGGENKAARHLETMSAAVPGMDQLGKHVVLKVKDDDEAAALKALDRAIEINPDEPYFRFIRVRFLNENTDWESARTELENARSRFPENPRLKYLQTQLAAETGEELDQALEILNQLAETEDLPLRIRPEGLLLRRGQIFEHMGETELALRYYRTARETAPRLVDIYGLEDRIRNLERRHR